MPIHEPDVLDLGESDFRGRGRAETAQYSDRPTDEGKKDVTNIDRL